jgi:hypothetical protein
LRGAKETTKPVNHEEEVEIFCRRGVKKEQFISGSRQKQKWPSECIKSGKAVM